MDFSSVSSVPASSPRRTVCVFRVVCVCGVCVVVPFRWWSQSRSGPAEKKKMHLHFEEPSSQLRCDSVINSLSWMGRVPDEQPEVPFFTQTFLNWFPSWFRFTREEPKAREKKPKRKKAPPFHQKKKLLFLISSFSFAFCFTLKWKKENKKKKEEKSRFSPFNCVGGLCGGEEGKVPINTTDRAHEPSTYYTLGVCI